MISLPARYAEIWEFLQPSSALPHFKQVFLQEFNGDVELIILVGFFLEAVAFVFGHNVPGGGSLLLEGFEDLIAFADRNARIVFAGDDHHGLLDFFDVVHGGDALQKFAHFGIAFIAVFHAAKIAAIRLGVFEKSNEVGRANDVNGASNAVAVERGNGKGHVTAVAASGNGNASGIKIWLSGDPIEEGVDVFIGALAKETIVQEREGLAITRGTANVGIDEGDAKFIQIIVRASQEVGTGLAFGAAMNFDQDRALTGKFGWRRIEKTGNHAAIKTFPVDELGFAE